MIIFGLLLTTFEVSNIFGLTRSIAKIGSSLIPNHLTRLRLSIFGIIHIMSPLLCKFSGQQERVRCKAWLWNLLSNSSLVSISPTFYEQLFRMKVFRAAFLYLRLRFVFFWQKQIGEKVARKMLVKLTAGRA